jgi:hypothetical protein
LSIFKRKNSGIFLCFFVAFLPLSFLSHQFFAFFIPCIDHFLFFFFSFVPIFSTQPTSIYLFPSKEEEELKEEECKYPLAHIPMMEKKTHKAIRSETTFPLLSLLSIRSTLTVGTNCFARFFVFTDVCQLG